MVEQTSHNHYNWIIKRRHKDVLNLDCHDEVGDYKKRRYLKYSNSEKQKGEP